MEEQIWTSRGIVTGLLTIGLMSLPLTPGFASLEEIHGINDVQYSPGFSGAPASEPGQTLERIRIDGSPVFRTPSGATFVSSTDNTSNIRFWAPTNESDPGSKAAALTGLGYTTGVTNTGDNLIFDLNTTVDDDFTRIFLGEISISGQLGDTITVTPLDGSNNPISTYSLNIADTDWGDQSLFWDPNSAGGSIPNIAGRLVSFQLSDFSGGTGPLTGVERILLSGNTDYDPNVVGTLEAGLLNASPAAAAAYSLRLLDDTYTGNAIGVRRASGGTDDIGFTFDGLLDIAALESFAAGEDVFVTTWYDQSGNGIDLEQTASAAAQPQIVSNGTALEDPNGNVALRYTGSQALSATASLFANSGETNVFTVGSFSTGVPVANSGTERIWTMSRTPTANTRLSLGGDAGNVAVMSASPGFVVDPSSKPIVPNEVFQSALLVDADNPESINLGVNRSSVLTEPVSNFANTDEKAFTAGAFTATGGSRGLNGWLNEIVIYNTALSDAQVNSISLNQMGAFGIVPEPSSMLGLMGLLFSSLLYRKRRSHAP